jgi:hypothetical protein
MPAQVPHTGRPAFANACSSGMRPHDSATSAIVVLSPPGMMSPMRWRWRRWWWQWWWRRWWHVHVLSQRMPVQRSRNGGEWWWLLLTADCCRCEPAVFAAQKKEDGRGGTATQHKRQAQQSARAFTRDHTQTHTCHARELLLAADLHHLHAWNLQQQGHVLPEGALQGQHADAHGRFAARGCCCCAGRRRR